MAAISKIITARELRSLGATKMATKTTTTTTKSDPWTCLISGVVGKKERASDKREELWIWRLGKQMLHKEWSLSSRTITRHVFFAERFTPRQHN